MVVLILKFVPDYEIPRFPQTQLSDQTAACGSVLLANSCGRNTTHRRRTVRMIAKDEANASSLQKTQCNIADKIRAAVQLSVPIGDVVQGWVHALRGHTATQRSKKGSEKVLGRVLGQKGSEKGACCGFYSKKGF